LRKRRLFIMAYSGPTPAATLDDLLQDLVDWAVANAGFTDEGNTSPPSGRTTTYMYRLSKGGMYWYFMGDLDTVGGADDGYIEFKMMTVLPTAGTYNNTSYGPQYITRAQLWRNTVGPYSAYNFFTDGNCVHVVVEVSPNVFSHFSFGKVTQFGTWTGGEYTTAWYSTSYTVSGDIGYNFQYGNVPFEGGNNSASSYCGYVYNPVGAYGDYRDFAQLGSNVVYSQAARFMTVGNLDNVSTTYNQVLSGPLFWCGANSINQRAPMIPQYLFVYNATFAKLIIAGYADHVKLLNMEFITPKDIVETDWEVFPLIQKFGDKTVAPITENLALAYRRA
jgi:hypothetical protein